MITSKTIFILLMSVFMGCNGSLAQEKKILDSFTKISISRGLDVHFTQANSYSIQIEGESKLVKDITYEIKSGILEISRKKNYHPDKKEDVKVYVNAPLLEKALINNGSDFRCEKLNVEGTFSLIVTSGSDVSIEHLIASEKTDISVNAGAKCKILELETTDCNLSAIGGSDIEIALFAAGIVYLKAAGGSEVKLRGEVKEINVNSFGGSDIDLRNLKKGTSNIKKSRRVDVHP